MAYANTLKNLTMAMIQTILLKAGQSILAWHGMAKYINGTFNGIILK